MNVSDTDLPEIAKFDPLLVQRLIGILIGRCTGWLMMSSCADPRAVYYVGSA